MSTEVKQPIAVICVFLWIGFVCAISFMEAWLKFHAPGVTLPVGLDIGRIVFSALNKVEWIFAIAIVINTIAIKGRMAKSVAISLPVIIILLILQTLWLLPALDARASLYINNSPVQASNLHFYFISAEIIKVICLFIMGISQFQKSAAVLTQLSFKK